MSTFVLEKLSSVSSTGRSLKCLTTVFTEALITLKELKIFLFCKDWLTVFPSESHNQYATEFFTLSDDCMLWSCCVSVFYGIIAAVS